MQGLPSKQPWNH